MTPPSRSVLSLDGRWSLALLDVPHHEPGPVGDVTVPGAWTLQVPGCELSHGTVRYSRTLTVPAGRDGDCLSLCFGAVNHSARVLLDGRLLGVHEGGWTPFEVGLPASASSGEHLLEVEVGYPALLSPSGGPPGMQEWPHGKQSWYGTTAGIWQPVTLERRPARHLRTAVVTTLLDGAVRAEVHVDGPPQGGPEELDLLVEDRATGAVVAQQTVTVDGPGPVVVGTTVPDVRPWSPEDPHLYDVRLTLRAGDRAVDGLVRRTGFRALTSAGGRLLLNGSPVEMRGVLDQDYHPGSEVRPTSREEQEDLFRRTKALGFNLLRCHIKRPDPMYLELADEVGLMVWWELPSWQRLTEDAARNAEHLLADMVALDGHHPSVVVWTVANESWGVDIRDEDQRAWLVRTQQALAARVPGALVVDNSPCDPGFHVRTDIADYHAYRGFPEHRRSWDDWVADLAGRPAWLFSPHGDAHTDGQEPLVLSEFGNWGLPDVTQTRDETGRYPWWAAAGEAWAFGAARAEGVRERFDDDGLGEVFGSWEGFVLATQQHQARATRYQIGSVRRRPELSGYVLTQLSDVQWEANGLFDMDRRPRADIDEVRYVNLPSAVVLRTSVSAGQPGGTVRAVVDVVPDEGCRHPVLEVELLVGPASALWTEVPSDRRSTWEIDLDLPDGPAVVDLVARLWAGGELVARDRAEVTVLQALPRREHAVVTDDLDLVPWLKALDVEVLVGAEHVAADDPSQVMVARQFTAAAQRRARRGGRVLVLAEDTEALGDAFQAPMLARLTPRRGDGDWVPRFDWLRRSGPFAALPGPPLLDLAFEGVIGELVIDYLPSPLRPARLHSAVFTGWLQHRASTALTLPWSRGALTLSTFRLRGQEHDPMATALSRALLDVAEQG